MIKFKSSDFVIDNISIVASSFSYFDDENNSTGEIEAELLQTDFTILESEDQKQYKIVMQIKSPKRLPNGFVFSCIGEGTFSFRQELSDFHKDAYLKSNGVSFVIGHIRSFLLNLSTYSSGGTLLLPAISLHDLLLDHEKSEKRKSRLRAKESIKS